MGMSPIKRASCGATKNLASASSSRRRRYQEQEHVRKSFLLRQVEMGFGKVSDFSFPQLLQSKIEHKQTRSHKRRDQDEENRRGASKILGMRYMGTMMQRFGERKALGMINASDLRDAFFTKIGPWDYPGRAGLSLFDRACSKPAA
ncbi:hypothetical protein NL676_016384 [Syzygium grande]|nr:hypothetical protein NL676_016384 [Syzygium grande]